MTSSGQAWWGRGALQGGEEHGGRARSGGRGSLSRPHCPPPQKLGRASPPVPCPLRSRNPPLAPRHLTWRHPTAHGLTFRALLPHQPPARTFRTESAEHAPRPRGCLGPDSWPQQGAEPGWGPLPHRLGRGSQGTQVTAMRRALLEGGENRHWLGEQVWAPAAQSEVCTLCLTGPSRAPTCFLPVTKGRPTPPWPWWSTWPRSTCSWTADTSSGWRGMRAPRFLPSLEAGGVCAVKTVPARGRCGHTSAGLGLASCLHPPHPHLGTNPACVDDHVCVS